LFENIGSPVSRELMMKRLWDNDCFVDDNTLTVNIARIRKKLEEAGNTDLIQTRKGLGYMIG
jgi:DNA-binding response OmpR family regulator